MIGFNRNPNNANLTLTLKELLNMITLTFSVEEVNSILSALSKFPYEQVKGMIEKIQEQATPQVQQPPAGLDE
jgi:hypothetical protein